MPVRAQWAHCFIRKYRNFGVRVTSGTEASNNNVKSYLLNGMSHLYRLFEAIQGMLEDQEREFRQACAQDEVLTSREHVGRGSEYLGKLTQIVSHKALSFITREHRKALKAIPSPSNPWPGAIGSCADCYLSIELGIPCYHTIHAKLMSATPLTKWIIHPRWHLREHVSQDIYRRILDPKIATSRRGRPKNNPQSIPASMAVRVSRQTCSRHVLDGEFSRHQPDHGSGISESRNTTGRLVRGTIQQHRSKKTINLRSGNTTGVRAAGRRIQPSVRGQRSQWELSTSVRATPRAGSGHVRAVTATRAPRKCSKCHTVGHYKTSKLCPVRYSEPSSISETAQELTAHSTVSSDVDAVMHQYSSSAVASQPDADAVMRPAQLATSVASLYPRPPSHRTDKAIAIYQRYVATRSAWYEAQSRGFIKTNQEYRKAMGLASRYDEKSYEWCLGHEQMTMLCITSTGSREWTKEEKMAYLDWSKAERDLIEAQDAAETGCNPLGKTIRDQGNLPGREPGDAEEQDAEEQDASLSGERQDKKCIIVIS